MKIKLLHLISIFSLTAQQLSYALAQSNLSGRITDAQREGLPYVVLMLLDSSGERLIQHSLSDSLGRFSFSPIPSKQYILKTQYLGYKEYTIKCDLRQNKLLNLGDIILSEDTQSIDEITVTGYRVRPIARVVDGKLQIIVADSYLGTLSNALEVLRSTPSVSVSRTGELSLSSLGGISVYLNGRRIRLSGEALLSYLKAIPASQILRIETSANPNAEYDSEGAGGIINIVTRSLPSSGIFASFAQGVGYWRHFRANNDLSLSYGRGAWSLGVVYSQSFGDYDMRYGNMRTLDDKHIVSKTQDTDKRNLYTSSVDIAYNPNRYHNFLLNISANLHRGPGITETTTDIYNSQGNTTERLLAKNDYLRQRNLRYGAGLSYIFAPSDKHKLSIGVDWINFSGGATCYQPNTYISTSTGAKTELHFYSENSRQIDIYALTANYTLLFSSEHRLKAGAKTSEIRSQNDFKFRDKEQLDTDRSNRFNYNEYSSELYAQHEFSLGAWHTTLGLRAEYLHSIGILTPYQPNRSQEGHKLTRFNLFPSISIAYRPRVGEYKLSYTRRQDKPRYEDLNPFEYLLDELTYWRGNPFLKPQISHKVALGVTWNKLNLSASYQYIDDYFTSLTDVHRDSSIVMTMKNIGFQSLLTLEGNYTARPTSWWNMTLIAGGYYTYNRLDYEGFAHSYRAPWGMLSMTNSLHLPWSLSLELSGRYYSSRPGGSYEVLRSTGAIDLGINRSFLENRLRVSLLITDLLHSERWDSEGSKGGLNLASWGYSESRQVRLSLSYTFGKERVMEKHGEVEEGQRL